MRVLGGPLVLLDEHRDVGRARRRLAPAPAVGRAPPRRGGGAPDGRGERWACQRSSRAACARACGTRPAQPAGLTRSRPVLARPAPRRSTGSRSSGPCAARRTRSERSTAASRRARRADLADLARAELLDEREGRAGVGDVVGDQHARLGKSTRSGTGGRIIGISSRSSIPV